MGLACFKSWKYDYAARKGNRDIPASPGSYFFLSNSCGQGEEWLKTLNKRVWIPFTGVFGQRLEETVVYEQRYGEHTVPLIVEQCVVFIRQRGLQEVGLFRQPGQATLVRELQEAFDSGEKPSFDSSTDVHTVASLLKLYLRELPEPVVPFSHYEDFLLCVKHIPANRNQGLVQLKKLLHELPVANFNLLHYICQFLNEVQSHSSTNKMCTQNLATVFGPNILRPKAEDPESMIGGAVLVQQLMSELISEQSSLFVRDGDSGNRGHDLEIDLQTGRQGGADGEANPEVGLRFCPNKREMRHSQISGDSMCLSHLPIITDTETLPRSPLSTAVQNSSRMENMPIDTPITAVCNVKHSSHPNSHCSKLGALPSLIAPFPVRSRTEQSVVPPGTLRQTTNYAETQRLWEKHESSGASGNTLSIYDNLSLADNIPAVSSTDNSSWSSCESFLEEASCTPSSAAIPVDQNGDSSSALSYGPLSSGSSDVFLPSTSPEAQSALPSHTADSMHRLLADLKQQMYIQKAKFEAQIRSLEQRNADLQVELDRLRVNLEQRRRWYSMAEIKMRNAERARVDANRRNAALQQEMEQFFHTFEELTTEAKKTERSVQSV